LLLLAVYSGAVCPEEILSFFDGLELLPPGVVSVIRWNGDSPAPDLDPPTATFLGGVARKA